MAPDEKVNILLVDDQMAKLLTYEVILSGLGENLIKAASGKEALEHLLKNEIAVVLMDVCMPELDGFELASMIREHPRFQKIAMIFISAIHLAEIDQLRGYEMGAVDYVPVPVVPEVLRAKVKVFIELYRKNRQLELLNSELERRVAERTAELEASNRQLLASEQRRSLALAAGNMGSWDWDRATGQCTWDDGLYSIFGVKPGEFSVTAENLKVLVHPEDWEHLELGARSLLEKGVSYQTEFRVIRPNNEVRWCFASAAASVGASNHVSRVSGVVIDISERKESEERQSLLAREVDHRAKNAMAIVQSIIRLTKADNVGSYVKVIEGRIKALSHAHAVLSDARWHGADMQKLVDEELAPYRLGDPNRLVASGPSIILEPTSAQTLALTLHELATNAAKYGALSTAAGKLHLRWSMQPNALVLHWEEHGGPPVEAPSATGFGTRIINSSIQSQLGGTTNFDWQKDGLHFTLSVPRAKAFASGIIEANGSGRPSANSTFSTASRVMVVEDETFVAMVLMEQLKEMGLSVIGPFTNIAEATTAIGTNEIDAAILDVNLGGKFVYPVAELLAARQIPFVFITGYGQESIERRFGDTLVIEKPVELEVLEGLFGRRQVRPALQA
jgi:PAS domain S-box-containing protein